MWTFLHPWKVSHKSQIKSQLRFFNDYIVSNINIVFVIIGHKGKNVITFFPNRSFSSILPNDDSVYLAFMVCCQFVAFVMIPIKCIERTPNMKIYVQHRYQEWRSKNWFVNCYLSLKNKFCSKNHVTPLSTVLV